MIDTDLSTADLAKWLEDQTWSDFAQSLAKFHADRGYLTPKQEASARSMYAKVTARAAAKTGTVEIPTGMHWNGTEAVKVYTTRQSGRLVSKVLVTHANGDFEFVYRGRKALAGLSADTLLPADQAREFGRMTGHCINCLAQLSDERSLAAGFGATCAANHGWRYPTATEAAEILAQEAQVIG